VAIIDPRAPKFPPPEHKSNNFRQLNSYYDDFSHLEQEEHWALPILPISKAAPA
jgi:hypothetical protein